MMKATPEHRRSDVLRGLVACVALPLASCGVVDMPEPGGPIASAEWLLLVNATEIMLVVVVPVIVATLAFAWWYRSANPRAARSETWSYQGSVEFVVWSIPTLVVILLGGVCWIGSHQLDPRMPIAAAAKPLHIDVVALDWKWLFIYPDQRVAAVNRLVVPVGTPVAFRITAATVMNSFFVPRLGSQIYAMPGMVTELNLMADRPGEYPGLSANFSGDGFADMRFTAAAVPAGDFDRWIAEARGAKATLDATTYDQLTKPSRPVVPTLYRAVDPALFGHIVDPLVPAGRRVSASMGG